MSKTNKLIHFDTGPFRFAALIDKKRTLIKVESDTDKIYTSYYKNVVEILLKEVPGIFCTQCFNPGKKTFQEEARDTEVAHLFEHLFLKYFCDIKFDKGHFGYECMGFTQWDWDKEKKGTFDIWLNVGEVDKEDIKMALERSSALFSKIIMESDDEDTDIVTDDILIFPVPAPVYVPAR